MSKKTPLDRGKYARKKWWKTALQIIFGKTIPQRLFRGYLLAIIVGSLLLYAPFSLKEPNLMYVDSGSSPKPYYFYDAIFVACSAISDTGLTPAIISTTYTLFGQIVILCLIEIGGIGLLSIFFLLMHMFTPKKTLNLDQIITLQAERGNEKIAGTYKSLKYSVILIIVVEVVFGLIMGFWLCFMPGIYEQRLAASSPNSDFSNYYLCFDTSVPINSDTKYRFWVSLWQGFFTSVSAINNAGFDVFSGGHSMAALRNDWNVIFQILVIIEFVIGGIGFPLIYDLIEKVKHKRKHIKYNLSLFTKLALIGYLVVTVVGLAFAYGFEYGDPSAIVGAPTGTLNIAHFVDKNGEFGKNEEFNKAFAIFFNTMSTRSAGFSTVNQTLFSPGTQWTYIILMFIGGSPSSTGGGIRTTTLMIIIWVAVSKILGREHIVMFNKKIPERKVRDSLLITIVAVALVALISIGVFYCALGANSGYNVLQSFYEVSSAFGTVGLSMGFTSSINPWGLMLLIIIMFIGQLGISSTLLSWTKKNPKGNNINYPEEDVRIG